MSDKAIYEGDAAAQLGIGRETVQDLRRTIPLVKGKHWRYAAQKRVYIKPAGLKLLITALENPPSKIPPIKTSQDAPEGVSASGADKDTPPTESEAGAQESSAASGKSENQCPPPELVNGVLIDAKVSGIPRNTRLLECKSDQIEGVVLVRVASNKNWVPGMKLKVRRAVEMPSLWYLEGRSPRRKGHM